MVTFLNDKCLGWLTRIYSSLPSQLKHLFILCSLFYALFYAVLNILIPMTIFLEINVFLLILTGSLYVMDFPFLMQVFSQSVLFLFISYIFYD